MKVYLLLLLLLPLCSAQKFNIHCYAKDFMVLDNTLLHCAGSVKQACYTRDNQEKGCTPEENCSRPGWTCCHTDGCNL